MMLTCEVCILKLITVFSIIIFVIKYYMKQKVRYCRSPKSLKDQTVLITGANSGIGFETAVDMLRRGARVIMACRDKIRGEAAVSQIIQKTGRQNIELKLVDFSSLDSVRMFAREILETENRLDVLINNAGVFGIGPTRTEDGLDAVMQINYFAPFLLTNLLLGLLKKSAPSRIINVSSRAVKHGKYLDTADLNDYIGESQQYIRSKLCVILSTIYFSKKLRGTGITVNSLHPGRTKTNLYRALPLFLRMLLKVIAMVLFKDPKGGAQTSIYLAVDERLSGVSGEHFENCARVERYGAVTKNLCVARDLFKESMKLVSLRLDEMNYVENVKP